MPSSAQVGPATGDAGSAEAEKPCCGLVGNAPGEEGRA